MADMITVPTKPPLKIMDIKDTSGFAATSPAICDAVWLKVSTCNNKLIGNLFF